MGRHAWLLHCSSKHSHAAWTHCSFAVQDVPCDPLHVPLPLLPVHSRPAAQSSLSLKSCEKSQSCRTCDLGAQVPMIQVVPFAHSSLCLHGWAFSIRHIPAWQVMPVTQSRPSLSLSHVCPRPASGLQTLPMQTWPHSAFLSHFSPSCLRHCPAKHAKS